MALDTIDFVNKLIKNGYKHLCVVPCSFAKNIINEVINNDRIEYIPSASEAVAISVAAGLKMSGSKPIVIVQSSGLTNMGSNITSLLKPYGVTLPILTSWRTYNEGNSEIQHQHLAKGLPKLVEAKPLYRDFRAGDVRHSLADISKAKKLLEYMPTHHIIDGLEVSLTWYLKCRR